MPKYMDVNPSNYYEITPDGGLILHSAELPPGLWYDKEKQKYRVRVYYKTVTVHLEYHEKLSDAIQDWESARCKLKHHIENLNQQKPCAIPVELNLIVPYLRGLPDAISHSRPSRSNTLL